MITAIEIFQSPLTSVMFGFEVWGKVEGEEELGYLGRKADLLSAIAFAQGILGDAHDGSFRGDEQMIILKLDATQLCFNYGDKLPTAAYEEGEADPKSNKRIVGK